MSHHYFGPDFGFLLDDLAQALAAPCRQDPTLRARAKPLAVA